MAVHDADKITLCHSRSLQRMTDLIERQCCVCARVAFKNLGTPRVYICEFSQVENTPVQPDPKTSFAVQCFSRCAFEITFNSPVLEFWTPNFFTSVSTTSLAFSLPLSKARLPPEGRSTWHDNMCSSVGSGTILNDTPSDPFVSGPCVPK